MYRDFSSIQHILMVLLYYPRYHCPALSLLRMVWCKRSRCKNRTCRDDAVPQHAAHDVVDRREPPKEHVWYCMTRMTDEEGHDLRVRCEASATLAEGSKWCCRADTGSLTNCTRLLPC